MECPFCGSSVPEDLVTYGGPCPKCFAEIPGEEAPTDPGAEARAIQERKDRRGATIKAFVGLAAMAAVVSCTGIAALGVVFWPEPEVAVLDFDSMEYDYPEFELTGKPEGSGKVAQADPQPKGGSDPSTAPRPQPSKSGPDLDKFGSNYTGDDGDDPAAGLGNDGVAGVDEGPRGTRGGTDGPMEGPKEVKGIEGPKTQNGGLGIEIGPDIRRRGVVLDNPEAIRQMIGVVMRDNIPRLKMCYERELKKNPDLGGRWLLKYTVTKDGKAVSASATGRDTSNAAMEECMANVIESRWVFDRIIRDQPVQKTIAFRPG